MEAVRGKKYFPLKTEEDGSGTRWIPVLCFCYSRPALLSAQLEFGQIAVARKRGTLRGAHLPQVLSRAPSQRLPQEQTHPALGCRRGDRLGQANRRPRSVSLRPLWRGTQDLSVLGRAPGDHPPSLAIGGRLALPCKFIFCQNPVPSTLLCACAMCGPSLGLLRGGHRTGPGTP